MHFHTMNNRLVLLAVVTVTILKCGECNENPLVFSTKECQLKEPVYEYLFDFTSLRSDFSHRVVSNVGDVFDFNICGNINRSCDGRTNVAACLKRGDKEYVLGAEYELNYNEGKMFFTFFNGSSCPYSKDLFRLHVIIGCDYTVDKEQSSITPYANDACSFYITYETPMACLPESEATRLNSCSVKDTENNHVYNLLPLSDVNYRLSDRKGSAIVINVCKPVLYGKNAMCPQGSSICFVDLKSENFKRKFYNYGSVQSGPVIENGKLLMRHTSKTKCNATHNYSSIINFYCAKDVKNAHPELIDDSDCVYRFSLATPLACNDLAPCTVMAHGNEIINLSSLGNHTFSLNVDNKNYSFSICTPAKSPCLENDGACVTEKGQSTSLGRSNSNLRFNQSGSLYLLYEGDAKCQKSTDDNSTGVGKPKDYWSTKIEFICAVSGSHKTVNDLSPKIIENTNCQLLIHVETGLACHEQIKCYDKAYVDHSEDGTGLEVVDLTPLINPIKNYEATINANGIGKSTKFFLNVCRPLVPHYSWGCTGGSAVCMAEISSTSKAEKEKSMGFPKTSLRAINRTSAELLYLDGDQCSTDATSRYSSRIFFYCDLRAGRGTPILEEILECQYYFKWATNVICPSHMCDFNSKTCEISNKELDARFNLRRASFTDSGKINVNLQTSHLTLDLCNTHGKPVTDYSQGLVNLFFTSKDACAGNAPMNILLRLICSNEIARTTTLYSLAECNLVLEQRTPEICSILGLTPESMPPEMGTSSTTEATSLAPDNSRPPARPQQTSSTGAILGAILSLIFVVACLGVLLLSPARRNMLRRLFRDRTSAVRYSRVQSNEEANLLLEPNGEFTDSDDDMLL